MSDFYIIATPIGNYDDIGIRALEILKTIDFVVCESYNEYSRLCGYLKIHQKKYIVCAEHNEDEAFELSSELLAKGEKGALVSDCGTPLFEDPGYLLINKLKNKGHKIISIPGANSLVVALTLCPVNIKNFYFAGFLPRKTDEKKIKLNELLKRKETIILMESPYRLYTIIDLFLEFKLNRKIFIPFNLTMPDEKLFFGDVRKVREDLLKNQIEKGEFLIFII